MCPKPSRKSKNNILDIVLTDSTFRKLEWRGETVWCGKCIFCNKKLYVEADGTPDPNVTVEHIIPRSKGGTDDLENLALACKGCNNEKGIRHDVNKADRYRAYEIMEKLRRKRLKRWRNKDL